MENQVQPHTTPAADGGKVIAILSYVTVFGFIAALIMHSSNKTPLGAFHLRQALTLFLAFFAVGVISWIPLLGWIVAPLVALSLIVLWVFGFIAAVNGHQKPMPLIGDKVQEWFGDAFK